MPNFAIEHLSTRQLSEAWPILHATRAVPVAVWWENEAKDLIRRGGGVLVARTADGSIHGLATYESVDRPHGGRLLEVGKLIAFELNRKEPVRHALCEALDFPRSRRRIGRRRPATFSPGNAGYPQTRLIRHPLRSGCASPTEVHEKSPGQEGWRPGLILWPIKFGALRFRCREGN